MVRGGDGKMLVVTPGDMIADNATVKAIVPERIVVEEQTANGPETVIMTDDNGHVRFERKGAGRHIIRRLPPRKSETLMIIEESLTDSSGLNSVSTAQALLHGPDYKK